MMTIDELANVIKKELSKNNDIIFAMDTFDYSTNIRTIVYINPQNPVCKFSIFYFKENNICFQQTDLVPVDLFEDILNQFINCDLFIRLSTNKFLYFGDEKLKPLVIQFNPFNKDFFSMNRYLYNK